jgi:hypothetical protein
MKTKIHLELDMLDWRVPKEGTKSAKIYQLMRNGVRPKEISKRLNTTRNSVKVTMWQIRHPKEANIRQRLSPYYKRKFKCAST